VWFVNSAFRLCPTLGREVNKSFDPDQKHLISSLSDSDSVYLILWTLEVESLPIFESKRDVPIRLSDGDGQISLKLDEDGISNLDESL
jgi:hypothetical protein